MWRGARLQDPAGARRRAGEAARVGFEIIAVEGWDGTKGTYLRSSGFVAH